MPTIEYTICFIIAMLYHDAIGSQKRSNCPENNCFLFEEFWKISFAWYTAVLRETIFPFFIPKKGNLFFRFLFPSFALNKFIFFFSPCFLFPNIFGHSSLFFRIKKRSNCAWKQLLLFEKLDFLFYEEFRKIRFAWYKEVIVYHYTNSHSAKRQSLLTIIFHLVVYFFFTPEHFAVIHRSCVSCPSLGADIV